MSDSSEDTRKKVWDFRFSNVRLRRARSEDDECDDGSVRGPAFLVSSRGSDACRRGYAEVEAVPSVGVSAGGGDGSRSRIVLGSLPSCSFSGCSRSMRIEGGTRIGSGTCDLGLYQCCRGVGPYILSNSSCCLPFNGAGFARNKLPNFFHLAGCIRDCSGNGPLWPNTCSSRHGLSSPRLLQKAMGGWEGLPKATPIKSSSDCDRCRPGSARGSDGDEGPSEVFGLTDRTSMRRPFGFVLARSFRPPDVFGRTSSKGAEGRAEKEATSAPRWE
jgi:hypothetical protein